ncbi:hypothetical protein BDQ94DRAFT_175764 [Aspergillus welwitschiae]|uniref:Uncharacterized protein n=1 Tax=Aspergillus welwitschiae TaxID=1341132 RepID=A0A3F3PKL6_9EURO|nr:hypothetical protein BDQ94DRAFT_175764 [Aspergillus welwitschiae]RDH27302.1 hypothetical protein BDQ94DRAFT_175764 [Aspergillus welwitschiae]
MASYVFVAIKYGPLYREHWIAGQWKSLPPYCEPLESRMTTHTELQLLQDGTDLTTRQSSVKNVTELLLCESHRRALTFFTTDSKEQPIYGSGSALSPSSSVIWRNH